jgi:hypothetical protein
MKNEKKPILMQNDILVQNTHRRVRHPPAGGGSWFLHSHLDNFIVTRKSCPLTVTLLKLMPTLTPLPLGQAHGNSIKPPIVRLKLSAICHIDSSL